MESGINMEFRLISGKDLRNVWKLQKEYVDEKTKLKEIKELYLKYPKLFVGCYIKNKLIGICIPGIFDKEIYVKGIAVEHNYWKKGIGSRLLKLFEKQLKSLGKKKVTVPSADIDWVEGFYLKNRYKPIQFLIKVKREKLSKDYKNKGYKILNERAEGKYKIFYINIGKYDPKLRERLKILFNADEVIYIMEKKL
ncbi:hypothetical protein DRN74_05020 [Candidatus Micrarchaeota archaeon]|nr:MAG: hypothetical protein DRN74_05020 [Candidatus Micrarchaeota archaeon]